MAFGLESRREFDPRLHHQTEKQGLAMRQALFLCRLLKVCRAESSTATWAYGQITSRASECGTYLFASQRKRRAGFIKKKPSIMGILFCVLQRKPAFSAAGLCLVYRAEEQKNKPS